MTTRDHRLLHRSAKDQGPKWYQTRSVSTHLMSFLLEEVLDGKRRALWVDRLHGVGARSPVAQHRRLIESVDGYHTGGLNPGLSVCLHWQAAASEPSDAQRLRLRDVHCTRQLRGDSALDS